MDMVSNGGILYDMHNGSGGIVDMHHMVCTCVFFYNWIIIPCRHISCVLSRRELGVSPQDVFAVYYNVRHLQETFVGMPTRIITPDIRVIRHVGINVDYSMMMMESVRRPHQNGRIPSRGESTGTSQRHRHWNYTLRSMVFEYTIWIQFELDSNTFHFLDWNEFIKIIGRFIHYGLYVSIIHLRWSSDSSTRSCRSAGFSDAFVFSFSSVLSRPTRTKA